MADRVVKVTLTAQVAEYKRGMLEAATATRTVGTEAEKFAQTREAMNTVGRAGVAMGGLIAAGVGVAISKFVEFDKSMSAVQAATHESTTNMGRLREAALAAGADTVFSATESAGAIEELAKAGVSTTHILTGGLTGALDLAAAGGLDVASAAGIAATALNMFNLKGSDMSHVADLLAAGAGKAMGDVEDLGMALNQAGLVASKTGLSIEETTAGLAAFASQGLIGSDAGTSFKTMLLALNPQSEAAAKAMNELGISAYDQQGNFIGLAEYAGVLQRALGNMSAEQQNATLKTIFGNDAYRAAAILLDEGEGGIRNWIAAVDDQGYAAETAAARLDNLAGDWEKLTGAIDTALITMGSAADGPLRAFVQGITGLVDAFVELPDWMQQSVLVIGGVIGAISLLGGAFFLAVPKVFEYKIAIESLGPAAQKTSAALAAFGKGVAIASTFTAALTLLDQWLDTLSATDAELENISRTAPTAADALDRIASSPGMSTKWWGTAATDIGSVKEALEATQSASESFWGWFTYTPAHNDTIDVLNQYGDALASLAATDLPSATAKFKELVDAYDLNAREQAELLDQMPAFRDHLVGVATDMGLASDDATLLSLALGDIAPAADDAGGSAEGAAEKLSFFEQAAADAQTALDALEDAIRGFGSAQIDTEQAAISFNAAIADMTGVLDEGQGSMDLTTEAGRRTREAMLDVATSTNDYAASVKGMGGGTEEVQGILEAGRQKIIDTMVALNVSEDAARAYADSVIYVGDVSGSTTTTVDISRQALRDAAEQMGLSGGKADALATSIIGVGNANGTLSGTTEETRNRLIAAATQMGLSQGAAEAFADAVMGIPPAHHTDITTNADDARAALDRFRDGIASIPDQRTVYLYIEEQRIASGAPRGQLGAAYENANGGFYAYANGGMSDYSRAMVASYASGGFPTGIYAGGEPIHKFAEPETRWEAYISGRPGQERRNTAIAMDSLDRLGALDKLADVVSKRAQPTEGRSQKNTFNVHTNDPAQVAAYVANKLRR